MCFPKPPPKPEIPAYTPPVTTEKKEAAVKVASDTGTAGSEVTDEKRRRKVSTALGL